MADDPKKPENLEEDDEARAFILARRAKFVAAALAGAGFVSAACGGESKGDGTPQPCLDIVQSGGNRNSGGRTSSGGAQVCLSPPTGGYVGAGGAGGFSPCLSIATGGAGGFNPCLGMPATGGAGGEPADAGDDAAPGTGGTGSGGMPLPCLSPPQGTGGAPTPCLSLPALPEDD